MKFNEIEFNKKYGIILVIIIIAAIFFAFVLGKTSGQQTAEKKSATAISIAKKKASESGSAKAESEYQQFLRNSESVESDKPVEEAKTVSFTAAGDYECGKDFNPGTYYVVLTKFEYAGSDPKKLGNMSIEPMSEIWADAGSKKRETFAEGDPLTLSDVYSPNWTLTLFSEADYQKDGGKNTSTSTKPQKQPESSSESSASATSESTTTTTSKKDSQHLQHVRDYKDRNASDVGTMRIGGDFMDDYAGASIKIIFVSNTKEQVTEKNVSKYIVEKQEPAAGTDINITYDKDENGKELKYLGDPSVQEIVVHVRKE